MLFSLIPVGFATNSMGGAGGPLAVLFVTILAAELGKAVSKETKIDILVTPIVTVLAGIGFAALIAAPVGKAASAVGQAIMWATELQPFFMGDHRLRGHRCGFDAAHLLRRHLSGAGSDGSGRRRRRGRLLRPDDRLRRHELPGEPLGRSGGAGTWHQYAANGQHRPQSPCLDPPTLAAAVTGPIATCVFELQMNGPAVSSGMGTCGLVGQIGVYTGWVSDVAAGLKPGIGAMDWLGLALISFVLPAVLTWLFAMPLRKWGWIKPGDLKLDL